MSAHLTLPDEALEQLAAALLPLVERLEARAPADAGGWLNPARAAEYLSAPRRRIYDLKSMGVLEPDGYDGRTPLWRRPTLDAYPRSQRSWVPLPRRCPRPRESAWQAGCRVPVRLPEPDGFLIRRGCGTDPPLTPSAGPIAHVEQWDSG